MYVLWGLNLALVLFVIYSSTFVIIARVENFLLQRRIKKSYTLWENKGLIAVLAYFCISLPAHFIMIFVHFIDPFTRVGVNLLPTCSFFFTKLGFYTAVMFTQGPFLASALKGNPNQATLSRANYQASIFVSSLSIFLGALPFIIYGSFLDNYDAQFSILEFYYFVQAAVLGFNGVMAHIIKLKVFRLLDKGQQNIASSDVTHAIKIKISGVQTNVRNQGLMQCAVYILMGAVPFLVNKHAYFLPISWFAMPILGKNLAHQINLDKSGKRTLMERMGLKPTGSNTAGSGGDKKSSSIPTSAPSAMQSAKPGEVRHGSFSETNPLSVHESHGPAFAELKDTTVPSPQKARSRLGDKKPSSLMKSSHNSSTTDQTFHDLIEKDSEHRRRFVQFIRSKFATEELMLYDLTTEFHRLGKNPKTKQSKLNALGKKICQQHLVPNAAMAVDLPDSLRKIALDANARGEFTRTQFDVIRSLTFNELRDNFYFQFLRSTGLEGEQS